MWHVIYKKWRQKGTNQRKETYEQIDSNRADTCRHADSRGK